MRLFTIVAALVLSVVQGRVFAAEPLVHEAVIAAPVAKVWDLWTTSKGLESWMAPHVEIELSIGGLMRSTYKPDGVIGDDSTITNTILSFLPQRMLSFRNTGQPKDFPFKAEIEKTWSVVEFEPVGDGQTRITITGLGYGDDDASQKMRAFFEAGNQHVLNQLAARFANDQTDKAARASDEARILELVQSLVGGDWIHENIKADGSIFRSRSVSEPGPDGQSVISKGWLGDAEGMLYHGSTLVFRQPDDEKEKGGIWFHNINEGGAISRGEITLINDSTLQWDWNLTSLEGQQQHYRVLMNFTGRDAYTFQLYHQQPAGAERKLIEVPYQRVAESPEAFRRSKKQS